MSSDRRGNVNEPSFRNRRSSHSPPGGSGTKRRGSPGRQSVERGRDHKTDSDRLGVTRENSKNSYTSATGVGGAGRDRDLRRSDLGSTTIPYIDKDCHGTEDKPDNKIRDFQRRNNERFDQKGKRLRDISKERNKDQWSDNSRGEGSRTLERRNNDRGNIDCSFGQRKEAPTRTDRDRRGNERSGPQRDSEKARAGYDRTPTADFRSQAENWNKSPLGDRRENSGDRNRDNWDDDRNTWNRDRGASPLGRRGGRQREEDNNAVLSGANSVPVKIDQSQGNQRRGRSPFADREKIPRSRSRERLLPHQALNRSSGVIGGNIEHSREERRSVHERDRSPRVERNIRSSGEYFDRRRSPPKDGNRRNITRPPPRRGRLRGNENFGERRDRKWHKESPGNNMPSRMDRSRSREAKRGDKYPEEGTSKSFRVAEEGM